ncbi:MAG: RIP metalloprotease RseP [Lysobacterales bacterium]
MSEVVGSIWWLLVALGLLVTFHEFGHFYVARRLGVRVLRFSIGFGRPLWSRRGRDGVEYAIAAIPLGGYVKMLDEREGEVPPGQLDQAFNRKPLWNRVAIVLAGPVFNLVFALAAFWLMFMVGIPDSRPIVGEVSGIASVAGLEAGDEILSIDDEETQTWSHALLGLISHALDRDQVQITVRGSNGGESDHLLDLTQLPSDFNEENTLEAIGLKPWRYIAPPVIGTVSMDSPAAVAGLYPGDRILMIEGQEVADWSWVGRLVQEKGGENQPLIVTIDRDGKRLDLPVQPRKEKTGLLSSRLILGISNVEPDAATRAAWDRSFILLRYGPLDGLLAAATETWRLTGATLGLLARMVTGKASVKNLSGPISIAQFANSSANMGLSNFLFFLAVISLSLGILNLLPVPVLDGGHLLYYLIEWFKGSPVSERAQMAGQYAGLMVLAGLMSLAFVNDILRLIG